MNTCLVRFDNLYWETVSHLNCRYISSALFIPHLRRNAGFEDVSFTFVVQHLCTYFR